MIRTASITAAVLFAATAAALVGGCGDQNKPRPYGQMDAGSPTSPDAMTPPPALVVPAGATVLSTGTYNQVQFSVPNDSGSIYVFDQEENKVVGLTNSVASQAGRTMTMTDLKNNRPGAEHDRPLPDLLRPDPPDDDADRRVGHVTRRGVAVAPTPFTIQPTLRDTDVPRPGTLRPHPMLGICAAPGVSRPVPPRRVPEGRTLR